MEMRFRAREHPWPMIFTIPTPRGRYGPASAAGEPSLAGRGSMSNTAGSENEYASICVALVAARNPSRDAGSRVACARYVCKWVPGANKRARKSTSPSFRKYRQGAETATGDPAVLYTALDAAKALE